MADTIESFVEKLQEEGVQVGRREAEKLTAQAAAEGEKIVAEAKGQAETILSDARAEAERILKRGGDELELAARDVLLSLRQTVSETLSALLKHRAGEVLGEKDFLAGLIREIAVQYAAGDASGQGRLEVNVSGEMLSALADWALHEVTADQGHVPVDLKGGLKTAGFEYTGTGSMVEVTPESIAAVLGEMISPRLRELIKPAGDDQKPRG